ncbi:hypothetical protein [Paenibacillus donghaensis]|uniref:Uncharacterized protein n=1 Tax=Paenibacillus donghaensis TaxID=414771 RepID=A0A2Z2K7T8_9BACL|nr:hypothetical protein [Paenibacillus donghaensis]ASA22596.1 hypothetical protein B9T62_18490 [Paenibacillus donghaensis]
MTKFYGIATTQSGTSKVIKDFVSTDRLGAENEAKVHCKKEGLIFGYILPDKSMAKGGSPLTKNKKQRDLKAAKKR